jgi:SAM-dependent methyltransferase
MNNFDDKLEIQKQWNTDPCGADSAREHALGTPAFFRAVEAERYGVYAPWMREAIGFGGFGGKKVLEIGPGLGSDHAQFARAGAEMYALDLTARHLDLTRRRIEIEGLITRAVRADAEALPSPMTHSTWSTPLAFCITPRARRRPSTRSAVRSGAEALRSLASTTSTQPSTGFARSSCEE